MKRDSKQFLIIRNEKNKTVASFRNYKLTVLNSEAIRLGLLDIVTIRDSELEINLSGVKFIDSSIFDVFNLLSRMGKRFNSRVYLSNVGVELLELIELVKLHSVFDIKKVIPASQPRKVA